MSSKSNKSGKINNDRSQSVVDHLSRNTENLSIDDNSQPLVRSHSTIVSERFTDATSSAAYMHRGPMFARPDKGGSDGRPTQLKANFYKISIDYSVSAYQYHAEIVFLFTKKDGSAGEAAAKKEIKSEVIQELFKKNNFGLYAFDGNTILFTLNKIDLSKVNIGFDVKFLEENNEENKYMVKLKLAPQTIDLKTMELYLKNISKEMPKTAINLLNVIIRQNKMHNHKHEKNSMFSLNEKFPNLGEGLCYSLGHYLSVKGTQLGWMQNVDMVSAVFYKNIMLDEFLKDIFNNRIDLQKELNADDHKKFDKDIRGVMIETIHLDNKRKRKVFGLTKLSANKEIFELEKDGVKQKISVAQYFKETYHSLKYPNLPCVKVGDIKRPIFFPIEVCKISECQRYRKQLNPRHQKQISKETVLPPADRAKWINKTVLSSEQDLNYLKKFGIQSLDQNEMTTVNARVLNSPDVVYREFKTANVKNGQWRMANNRLFESKALNKWAIIWMANDKKLSNEDFEFMKEKLLYAIRTTFTKGGLVVSKPIFQNLSNKSITEVFDLLNKNMANPQLVMFVINDGDEREEIKNKAEKEFGIATQCIKYEKLITNMVFNVDVEQLDQDRKLSAYISNVLLKVNAKIGGTNNCVNFSKTKNLELMFDRSREPVMFFGADVTHHTSDYKKPSIAAVVGSIDLNFTHYCVKLSEQFNENSNKFSKEIIVDLEEMSYLLMSSFKKKNNILPKRLIFYRDGIDEGQFEAVVSKEVQSLKQACKRFGENYNPTITFIIVQKNHHTRLFPIADKDMFGKSCNIPAGTVVDTGITNLNEFDFYLCSHETIQGTAKPTHYWVIYDENKFTSNDIQNLTFMMCHLYVKSTKSVSIPAPVYYSHLAAFRGRLYTDETIESELLDKNNNELNELEDTDAEELNLIKSKLIQIHPNLDETMFFA